ncbi:hypothetical protein PHYBLDRAFT_116923 [Phycomyces blakesleeanus NRRL 1555(-)]|uniref:J domain-containing protein n=1 Tax=Phycomyces blakesleeanus (strain ATCC 8743b / DSM 1359 / FGSC 10004 / NBRC 33097 / NRRL 1555) TaxID=763407 RepID=A0A162ZTU7_PHYB8|nr:hypothetical protein PHYBLDRAFT_116923 [Phycomyces blakesleeanus NRRL 1555(-)]OAD68991.1 hypothetical protein PHYBLDRAFT_116923 [Phycomyces blakesleeanus NRRL 1555(-)]|eukprot:XP_018287031.1 hypothetical protein PHYBLDRAFT_116923 [Phycomyces blakesleeanus NRRL 1555(-)]
MFFLKKKHNLIKSILVDHAILNVLDEIKKIEGKYIDIYTWLEVPPTSSFSELNAILRRKTVEWHPSTNPRYTSTFKCLEKAAPLLRNPDSRERIDHFYIYGIPFWRGFKYHLNQCRKSFWVMSIVMIFITGMMEYMSVYLAYLKEAHILHQFIKSSQRLIDMSPQRVQFKNHKSYIDLGDRVLTCKIRSDRTIWVINEQGEEVLFGSDWVKRPSMIENIFWMRWSSKLQKTILSKTYSVKDKKKSGLHQQVKG